MHSIFDRAFTENSQLTAKRKYTMGFKGKANQGEHFGMVNITSDLPGYRKATEAAHNFPDGYDPNCPKTAMKNPTSFPWCFSCRNQRLLLGPQKTTACPGWASPDCSVPPCKGSTPALPPQRSPNGLALPCQHLSFTKISLKSQKHLQLGCGSSTVL